MAPNLVHKTVRATAAAHNMHGISTSSCTQHFIHETFVFYVLQAGGYIALQMVVTTQGEAKYCLLCVLHLCGAFFILALSLSLSLCVGIFLSMCACALNRPSFHVFFFNDSMYSSPCVLIYSACVRQTTFNVYRIHFKFYRFDVASYWVGSLLLCCSMLCPIQCIKMVAHRQSTKTFSWNIHKIKSFLVIWCCSHDCHSCIQFFGYLPSHSKFHRRK